MTTPAKARSIIEVGTQEALQKCEEVVKRLLQRTMTPTEQTIFKVEFADGVDFLNKLFLEGMGRKKREEE